MLSRRLLAASTVLLLAVACANGGVTGLEYEEDGGTEPHESGTGADGTTSGHDSGSSGGNDAAMSMETASGVDSSSGGDTGSGGTCAQTCSGCCTGTGGTVCVTATSNNLCGTLGSPCQNCTASGLSCIGNACLPGDSGTESGGPDAGTPDAGEPDGNPDCPTTCKGAFACCDANNVCQTGHTNTACPENNSPGMPGQPCVDCTSMGPAWTCFLDIIEYVCIP